MLYLDIIEDTKGVSSYIYFKDKENYGYGLPDSYKDEDLILTQNKDIYNFVKKQGLSINFLSSCLNLQRDIGLYEVFSFFFDGKIEDDFDMLDALFTGVILPSDKHCFCLKLGVSFCWFIVLEDRLKVLGTMQFSDKVSKYSIGKFVKRLRYEIARSGYSLDNLHMLCWDKADMGTEFSRYFLDYSTLEDFFMKIDGLKGLSCLNIMRLLSRDLQGKYTINAELFIRCLNSSFRELGIQEKNGVLYSKNVYFKDYSTCISSIIRAEDCSYGIILDCEGVKQSDGALQNGVDSIGGIIYCKYDNILLNVSTFQCDKHLLSETLNQVIIDYKKLIGKNVKSINVITFGESDEIMLKYSCSKKIFGLFNFVDCKKFITNYLDGFDGSYSLSNIAKFMSVASISPKHSPLNDARTLFNILAKILYIYGKFVI